MRYNLGLPILASALALGLVGCTPSVHLATPTSSSQIPIARSTPTALAPLTMKYVTVTLYGTDADFEYSTDKGSSGFMGAGPLTYQLRYKNEVVVVAQASAVGSARDAGCKVVSDTGVTIVDHTAGSRIASCDITYTGD
ncbi:MAG TPA: hypothetical protein VIJ76_01315 [Galbitalea sp.]